MKQTERIENETSMAMHVGFTLIEILVAVAIIGILGTVAVSNVVGNIEMAKVKAADESCRNIKGVIVNYYTQYKKYPNDLRDLITAHGNNEPLLEGGEGALEDPWGNEYKYEKKGKHIAVISAGPDGEFGNDDDLRSDKIKKASEN